MKISSIGSFWEAAIKGRFSVILVYLSFATYFIKNNSEIPHLLVSKEGIVVMLVSVLIQVLFNYFLRNPSNGISRIIYIEFVILAFTFLNLAYFLTYLEQLNVYTNGVIRVRLVLLMYVSLVTIFSFYAAKTFRKSISVINTFLCVFIITSILYSDFSAINWTDLNRRTKSKTIIDLNPEMVVSKHHSNNPDKRKILFIVLDEYASEKDLLKFASPDRPSVSLNKFLLSKGFTVITKIPTLELSTINSINQVFNSGSGLTFTNKSIENVSEELREASVVKNLNHNGYDFKNFGFFNIGGNKEFYFLYPFPRNNFETLFKNSMLFLVLSNLTFKNLTNFQKFKIYADYNKKLYAESLAYLNNSPSSKKDFIYVHFEMPHPPFYAVNEFSDRPVTLNNYIEYWSFANEKVIQYLNSIKDLGSYKIIITGDHGYRRDKKRLDPYITTAAFYNFETEEVRKVSTVQDIGRLLLIE